MAHATAGQHRRGHSVRRRAISEMLGVIILLTITVVAAVLVYQIFIGKANVAASAPAISIQSAAISGDVLTITVQNTGTTTLSNFQVSVYNPQGGGMTLIIQNGGLEPVTLAPGQTASGVYTNPDFEPGLEYRIVVTASSSPSGNVMATATVMAS